MEQWPSHPDCYVYIKEYLLLNVSASSTNNINMKDELAHTIDFKYAAKKPQQKHHEKG